MVAVHFSTRCGAACSFCYFSDPLAERVIPTPIHQIRAILEKLAREGVSEVLFVGGDPVVHPQFEESLKIAKQLGLTISVLSNSWAVRPQERFSEAVSLIDNCEATILGASSTTHDALTQRPGSYAHLINNLKAVAETGKRIGICANAMPGNLSEMYDLVAAVSMDHGIPVKSFMIQRIIPSGSATGDFRFGLNLADVEVLMKQIDRVATEFGIPILFEDPVPWCTVEPKYHKYLARCEWGYTRGAINSKGELNRCGADDHYRLGTIWDAHVQEIWRKHPILQSFRSKAYLPDECKACELLDRCGGGCPLSCGTLKDHDVDQLYVQKIQMKRQNAHVAPSIDGQSGGLHTIRYAYPGDLDPIVGLERLIFSSDDPLLSRDMSRRLFRINPKAFRVATSGGVITGYAVVFPLTSLGLKLVSRNEATSIIDLPDEALALRFSGASGLFCEVIASIESAPVSLRVGLLRNVISTIRKHGLPVFTCAVSRRGLEIAQRLGCTPVGESGLHKLYLCENGWIHKGRRR